MLSHPGNLSCWLPARGPAGHEDPEKYGLVFGVAGGADTSGQKGLIMVAGPGGPAW